MAGPDSPSSPTQDKEYWAFLSYSHQDNLPSRGPGDDDRFRWAGWLHEQIEKFRVPDNFRGHPTRTGKPMPDRFFPCFRDEAELPTSHDLGGQIRDALARSLFLIVIASPRSARSRYVNEEVRYFRQLGRDDRILTIIVDGEPNVRLHPTAGWSADDECFCPALVHPLGPGGEVDTTRLLPEEPIAADVRARDAGPAREMRASELDQPGRRALLEHAKLKLIAGLMGVGLDDLVERDKRRREAQRLKEAQRQEEREADKKLIQELKARPAHVVEAQPQYVEELERSRAREFGAPHDWATLLHGMKRHRVVPILGPELLAVPSPDGLVAVADLIARELAGRYGVPWEGYRGSRALNRLWYSLDDRRGDRSLLAYDAQAVAREAQWPAVPAYATLASMPCWPTIFTGGFTQQLEQALEQAGLLPRAASFSPRDKKSDLPIGESPSEQRALQQPWVFHFLGDLQSPEGCALTDEQETEWMDALKDKERKPQNLFWQVRNRDLLVLGGGYHHSTTLPDLLRTIIDQPLTDRRQQRIYIHPGAFDGRAETLRACLGANALLLPFGQEAPAFLAELADRWKAHFAPNTGD